MTQSCSRCCPASSAERQHPPRARRAHAPLLLDARALGLPALRARARASRAPGTTRRLARSRQPPHDPERTRRDRGWDRGREVRRPVRPAAVVLALRRWHRNGCVLSCRRWQTRRHPAGSHAPRRLGGARRRGPPSGARRSARPADPGCLRRVERGRDRTRRRGALCGRGRDLGRLRLARRVHRGRPPCGPRFGDRVWVGVLSRVTGASTRPRASTPGRVLVLLVRPPAVRRDRVLRRLLEHRLSRVRARPLGVRRRRRVECVPHRDDRRSCIRRTADQALRLGATPRRCARGRRDRVRDLLARAVVGARGVRARCYGRRRVAALPAHARARHRRSGRRTDSAAARAAFAAGIAIAVAPFALGGLADASDLQVAYAIVPVLLGLGAVALALRIVVRRP